MNLNIIFNEAFQPQQKYDFAFGLIIIGAVVALLVIPISRIITERIKIVRESALRIADGDLSRRVKIKTSDEIGELGLAFNQMAERLERMILGGKELTANVSHELRTPLTRIRIAEELLREQFDKKDFHGFSRHLDSIREDIDELDVLIGRILELSKLDIQETTFNYEKFDISDLLNEILERIEPVKIHKKLLLKTKLPSGILVSGDRNSIFTAFLNILDNAVKFSPENGEINIKLDSYNDSLSIRISNTFERMPEEDLTRIFEPFYRSNTTNAAGSGLGLSIASKIIQKHGGNISAANSKEGLQITVHLPLGKA
jgi:two-component system, OmpR family, sensor histidine kinase CpxA